MQIMVFPKQALEQLCILPSSDLSLSNEWDCLLFSVGCLSMSLYLLILEGNRLQSNLLLQKQLRSSDGLMQILGMSRKIHLLKSNLRYLHHKFIICVSSNNTAEISHFFLPSNARLTLAGSSWYLLIVIILRLMHVILLEREDATGLHYKKNGKFSSWKNRKIL